MENQGLITRRHVVKSQSNDKIESVLCDTNFSLNDKRKVWPNGKAPNLPDFSSGILSNRWNNGTTIETESDSLFQKKLKLSDIESIIQENNLTYGELKRLGFNSEGFVTDQIRRFLWPRILEIPDEDFVRVEDLEDVHTLIDKDIYEQILKDIARSNSHLNPNATEQEIQRFHEELTQLICWVIQRHPSLNYYQGYHDIAATILLVMGLQRALYVLERLTLKFLQRFMEKTMEKVNQELFYIFALLERMDPQLLEHLENVELFPHFALAEYTTWYAHKYAENRKLLHRLFDYFLAGPLLLPLYLSTTIVDYRHEEIINTTPADMGHIHKVLCTLPENLPLEKLLLKARDLYEKYPPKSIFNDVREYDYKRRLKEQEWIKKSEATRLECERLKQLQLSRKSRPQFLNKIRNVKAFTVVTFLAIGLYAYYKSSLTFN